MILLFGRLKSFFSEKYILHIRLRNDEAFAPDSKVGYSEANKQSCFCRLRL